ncbi:MAG: tetratricopeptide repeat protein [Acidobacteria bacterium]|nr:tetratricopeptide repeat protein [Acidobacteriota bacterium]
MLSPRSLLSLLSLLYLALPPALQGAAATVPPKGTALAPIPPIDVSAMEPAVREQVEAARRSLAAAPGLPAAEAAGVYGEAGKAFLLYALGGAATACFENAAALAPEDVRWSYYAGVLAQRLGDLPRARADLLRATALQSPFPAALYRLGEVELMRGDLAAADRAFSAALAFPGTAAAARFGLGRVALQRGDARLAAEQLEAVLEAQPRAAVVHAPLAAAYRRLGQLDKAQAHAAAYGAGEVQFTDVLMSQLQAANAGNQRRVTAATDAYNNGDYAAAAAEIRQAIAADPRDVRSWMVLGRCQERLGDAAGAEQSYRRAVEVDPNHSRARLSLGTLLAQRGARAEAIEQLAAAVRLRPDLPDARFNLAKALAEDGRLTEALAQCDALLLVMPHDRDAQALREQLRSRLGRGRSGREIE